MTGTSRALVSATTVVAGGAVLHSLGTGDLAPPPLLDVAAVAGWYEARDPATVAVALVRFAAELSAWYVLALTLLHAGAALIGSRGLTQLADALAVPGVRGLTRAGLGLGLLAATAVGSGGPDGSGDTGTATMRPVPSLDIATTTSGTATMMPLGDHPTATDREDPRSDGSARDEPVHEAVTPMAGAAPGTWRVDHGESFWSIADDLMTEKLGRPPSVVEIHRFWRSLIEQNRDRLVDPGNPDLILPGQVFDVPLAAAPLDVLQS